MLKIYERLIGGVVILDLSGDLQCREDEAFFTGAVPCDGCVFLRDRIRGLTRQGLTRLVLNLDGVAHVDSLGLGSLISSKLGVDRMGGGLKLLNPSGRLRAMLTVAKLIGRFEIFTSELDAVASFAAPVPLSGTDDISALRQ